MAQGISAKSREVVTLPMPDPTGRPGARFLQALIPDREEPPDAPRFRHARRLDPLGVEPWFSRQQPSASVFRSIFTALALAVSGRTMNVPFSIRESARARARARRARPGAADQHECHGDECRGERERLRFIT
jgi:hypothetical protein